MKFELFSTFVGISFLSVVCAMKAEGENHKFRTSIKWDVDSYEKSFELFQSSMAEKFIKKYELMDKIEGKDLLDIGCGHGLLTAAFGYVARLVHGIDSNSLMIEKSKKLLKHLMEGEGQENSEFVEDSEYSIGTPNEVTFECCPVQSFIAKKQYDYATAFFVLQWIPDTEKEEALKNIFNALRPGGSFFGTCNPDKKDLHGIVSLLVKKFPQLKNIFSDENTFNQFLGSYHLTAEKIKELFEGAGFIDVVISEESFVHEASHEELEIMYRPGVMGVPFMEQLNENEREEVFLFFLSLIEMKFPKNEDGKHVHTTPQFIIKAQKPGN